MEGDRWRRAAQLLRPGTVTDVVLETYEAWRVQRTVRLGAALAYYGLFALVPIVAISLALVSVFIADADVEDTVAAVFGDMLDSSEQTALAEAVTRQLESLDTQTGLGVLGFVGLLVAGSLLFVALADAANLIWDVPVRRGFRTYMRRRVLAFAIVLGFGGVVVGVVALRWTGGLLLRLVPSGPLVFDLAVGLAERVLTLAVLAVVVTGLFRVLAPVPPDLLAVTVSGIVTALFLVLAGEAFGIYLDVVFTSSLTGAAGGVLAFLLWMYAISQVVLAGMQLARTLDRHCATVTQVG